MLTKSRLSLDKKVASHYQTESGHADTESDQIHTVETPAAATIQRAKTNPRLLSRKEVLQLQHTIGNRAVMRMLDKASLSTQQNAAMVARQPTEGLGSTIQRDGLDSGKIVAVATGANVAKAPNNFSARRFKTRAAAVDGIDIDDLARDAGTLAGGDVAGGIRIDKQGDFNEGGKTFYNVQAQANDPVENDLAYPNGTRAEQKGTSLAEVHVDSRLPVDAKVDVKNRTLKLLKSSIYTSMGDRTTYPRPVYKVEI